MTCEQFQELLPDFGEGTRNPEYETHLRSCQSCWGMVSELNVIAQQARLLQAIEEPSPKVWQNLESALRKEGLIRVQNPQPVLVFKRSPRWNLAWMLPVAASLLVIFGIMNYQGKTNHTVATDSSSVATTTAASSVGTPFTDDDQKFLTAVAFQSPNLREKYEHGLRDVNAYIQDAQLSARNNPNDEEAQRYLMNAYDQKAMLYEMALDRTQ